MTLADIGIEAPAKALLQPLTCWRQRSDPSDETATKRDVEFYQDERDALLKAVAD